MDDFFGFCVELNLKLIVTGRKADDNNNNKNIDTFSGLVHKQKFRRFRNPNSFTWVETSLHFHLRRMTPVPGMIRNGDNLQFGMDGSFLRLISNSKDNYRILFIFVIAKIIRIGMGINHEFDKAVKMYTNSL